MLQEIDDIIDDDEEEEDNDSEREGAGGLRGGGGAGCSALSGYLPPHSIRSSTFIGADRTYYPYIYMIHVAMSPVLHVEGCRTLLGFVVVDHQLSGSLVCMSLWLSTCPLYFLPSLPIL